MVPRDFIEYKILTFLPAQRAGHPASFIPALVNSLFLSWPESNSNTNRNPDRATSRRNLVLFFWIERFFVTFSTDRLYMPTETDIEEGRGRKNFLQEELP